MAQMTALVICLGCAALRRTKASDVHARFRWALQCSCGAIQGPDVAALRAQLNALELANSGE